MTAAALQRVVVRCLFDPALHDAIRADGDRALAGVPLSADERRWITAADGRALRADPLRRRSALKSLMEEYRTASALAVGLTRRLATLDAFFSSGLFHRAVQDRGSLGAAFGAYLVQLADGALAEPRLRHLATLERALARVRRAPRPRPVLPAPLRDNGRYRTAPHVVPLSVAGGTLEVLHALERLLFDITLAPAAALADDGPRLGPLPALDASTRHLLAERAPGVHEATLADATAGLCGLLWHAATPVTGAALQAHARELGADAAEAPALVQGLLDTGLLRPC
ncbi:MAG: hypothetical protein HY904_14380 [Deltaproteobacteria bacterium]|nr:hypothetical protein [Deltaproteobacteria bacterium]